MQKLNSAAVHKSTNELAKILDARALTAVVQPVISLTTQEVLGYEGLVRGPAGSELYGAGALFAAADAEGLRARAELLAQEVVVESFVSRRVPGKLFLNVSPATLAEHDGRGYLLLMQLRRLRVPAGRVIIELTENQPTTNFGLMRTAMAHFRSLGFEVAIDDLGEGFSSLRLWSELHPEYVKLDMHFTQGIAQNTLKFQFVKAIQQIAESCGTRVIAEGVENPADLRLLRDLGIPYAQGFLIARPGEEAPAVSIEARQALAGSRIAVYPELGRAGRAATARKLLLEITPATPETTNEAAFARFDANSELVSLPVVRDGRPIGLVSRAALIDGFARPYRRELYGRKSCTMFMDDAPVVVDAGMTLQEISVLLAESDGRHLANGFIITQDSTYIGMGTGRDLIREINQMQMTAARYANPLTLLPGNVPIDEHIARLLDSRGAFCACHCDLDNFKPYNDVYGYHQGDAVIRLAAELLASVCEPNCDFLGHIGGDDFFIIFQSVDWQARCDRALREFGERMDRMLSEEERAAGGYFSEDRRGQPMFFAFPTLSIGAVVVDAATSATHIDVSTAAADAKRQAKRIPGNSLFVERRRIFRPPSTRTT
ncbi:MAG: GGDEF domain-containing protein [Rhodospirillaceae bacterium]